MHIIVMAEIISAIFVGVSLISQFSDKKIQRSTGALRLCSVLVLFWLCIDAGAYLINGPQYPKALLWVINFLAYTGGGIVFLSFLYYCRLYITERTDMKRWVLMVPAVVTVFNELVITYSFVTKKLLILDNGVTVAIGGIPPIVQLLNIIMLIYVPVAAFTKRKAIGVKAVSLLGMYGFAPIVAIMIVLKTGLDLTVSLGAVAVVVVASLLQTDEAQKAIVQMNTELEKANITLRQVTEEQETQLEEIAVLNHELEERQAQLEEVSAEQESHIEEATKLNQELTEKHERLILNNEIISSISKLYFAIFRIDLMNDFYEEISSDNDVHMLTGHEGAAYQKMMELCDSFVTEKHKGAIREFFDLKTLPGRLLETETVEATYLAKDGNWHQARFISKRRDNSGRTTHVLYVTRLVSAEKTREMEYAGKLEDALMAADKANEAKSAFLFSMSHDIRTPMNAIIGYTELMERYFDDPEKCRSYLKKVKGSSDFLLSLINNVLEMARIESGKAALDEVVINSRDICQNLDSVYEELMLEKNISYHSCSSFTTPLIYCDTVKANEIFLNLLSNAYKYTPSGGSVSLDVREIPSDREGFILVQTTVSDTGIGMAKDFLPHIFEEFVREHDTTETKILGTGLGMPIVKKLVDLMGGTISVESELGKGSTFVVTIPHRIATKEENKGDYHAEAVNANLEGKRILLAEDNDLNAEIAIEILQEAGFEIERAEDGIICVDMLSRSENGYYDMILMDIQMPNMDGYKATRVIRAMEDSYKRNIPVIAMTANAFDEDRRNALEAGMDGHVAKPINVQLLLETIAEVLINSGGIQDHP